MKFDWVAVNILYVFFHPIGLFPSVIWIFVIHPLPSYRWVFFQISYLETVTSSQTRSVHHSLALTKWWNSPSERLDRLRISSGFVHPRMYILFCVHFMRTQKTSPKKNETSPKKWKTFQKENGSYLSFIELSLRPIGYVPVLECSLSSVLKLNSWHTNSQLIVIRGGPEVSSVYVQSTCSSFTR
jgi:hypothetical protein